MADIPLDAQRQMRKFRQPGEALPAMYDELSWVERRQVREEYGVLQKGDCWHCHHPLDEEPPYEITRLPLDPRRWGPEFLKHPIHLHHDHRTGLTIGATHAYCNAVLAMYYGQ